MMAQLLGLVAAMSFLGWTGVSTDDTPSIESDAGWGTTVTVAHCSFAAPKLPSESETALDATLLVRTEAGTGSAFLISPDGFALTAAHVVRDATEVEVVAHGGARLQADVVRVAPSNDIALLKVDMHGTSSCLRLLEGKAPLGSDVFLLGSPAGEELSFSVSKGIVSGYRSFQDMAFVQLDASVNPGNSGGPAVDAEGLVVGIASWKVSHVSMEGLAFAVPSDVGLKALGVQFGDESSSDWSERTGRMTPEGVRPLDEVSPVGGVVGGAAPVTPGAQAKAKAFDPKQIRRDRLRRGFIVGGSITLASGAMLIASTYAAYKLQDSMKIMQWNLARGFNAFGWALSIGGAALLTTGLALPKKVGKKRASSGQRAELEFGFSPRGILVKGAF